MVGNGTGIGTTGVGTGDGTDLGANRIGIFPNNMSRCSSEMSAAARALRSWLRGFPSAMGALLILGEGIGVVGLIVTVGTI